MSKTKNNSAQDSEDVINEITQQDSYNSDNNIRCWVAQVKDGEEKIAETLEDGWTADGVAIIDSTGDTLLIVSLDEVMRQFGGDLSEDIDVDVASPVMSNLDGDSRTAFLRDFYDRTGKELPAISACVQYGWLPSGGEMALIYSLKDEINAVIAALGGQQISDGKYWTSQRFSNNRTWHCNMSDGRFGIALGTSSVAGVRAVKK